MRTRLIRVASAITLTSLLGVASVASAAGRPLATDLSGVEEVPVRDPDGSGFASITLNSGLGRSVGRSRHQTSPCRRPSRASTRRLRERTDPWW
jgi:hypothetical protein